MKLLFKKPTLTVLMTLLLISTAFAQRMPTLELYHGRDCPHCHKELAWLPDLQAMYPDLKVEKYEVWYDAANQQRFDKRMQSLGQKASGVPTNIINDEVIVGFDKESILALMKKHYGNPQAKSQPLLKTEKAKEPWYKKLFFWRKTAPETTETVPAEIEPKAAESEVTIGKTLPDFTAPVLLADDSEAEWKLSDNLGKWVLLFFYPKDRTFVCPTEIREMVAAKAEFERLGVEVVLASADSLESHAEWRPDVGGEDLTYPWMSDTGNKVAKLLNIYDVENDVPLRGTFLIDPEGKLQFQMTTNSLVGRNIDEIVRVIEANQTGELCPANWKKGEETLGEEPE